MGVTAMGSEDRTTAADGIEEAPQRSQPLPSCSAVPQSDGKQTWKCPHCEHFLSYRLRDREVAELAANSHIRRQHKAAETIVMLPES